MVGNSSRYLFDKYLVVSKSLTLGHCFMRPDIGLVYYAVCLNRISAPRAATILTIRSDFTARALYI